MRFSIIVPIYNVKRFIYEGIESLKNQTFRDFEILLIDDGSTDGSLELIKEYERRFPNIMVFSQPNKGAGPARNLGIQKAQGDYLVFFDIDDKLRDNALETINNALEDDTTELLIFSYCEIDTKYHLTEECKFKDRTYNSNEALKNDYVSEISGVKFNNGFVWNKVYKKNFIDKHKIKFEPLRIQQDEVFNLALYPLVTKAKTISNILYEYRVYHSGNTRNNKIPERFQIYTRVREAFLHLAHFWGIQDARFEYFVHRRFFLDCLCYIKENVYRLKNSIHVLKELFEQDSLKETVLFLKSHNSKSLSDNPLKTIERRLLKDIYGNNPTHFLVTLRLDFVVEKLKSIIKQLVLRR